MKTGNLALWGTAVVLAGALSAPLPALAGGGDQQQHKNNWRNLGIAGGALAGYGLLKHNTAATVLGAAGAAYSANRYEQDRKHQDQRKRARLRYHRRGGDYVLNGRKYYRYDGRMYYMDLATGERHRVG